MNTLYNPRFGQLGYIQIYTGDGKGKTTASIGLMVRALGRGWRVLFVMFTKGGDDYGELYALKKLSPEIAEKLTIVPAGLNRIVFAHNMNKGDLIEITNGWEIAKNAVKNNEYDIIILDEANIAIDLGLIELEEMKEFLLSKPPMMEIVLTGRRAHPELIEIAHLVSRIEPVKHYWDVGIMARGQIEY